MMGMRSKRPVSYDYQYDHLMAIILSQTSLGKCIKAYGNRAVDVTTKEFSQLDEKGLLLTRRFSGLSRGKRSDALPVVVLIIEKRNGEVKRRAYTNGRKQRLTISPEDVKSPTEAT